MVEQGNDRPDTGPGLRVVAIGASAGGVQALKTFFEHAPADAGLVYVVVLHLSPEHESQLASVLQRATRMPVQQIADGVSIEVDHVYVIAPKQSLTLAGRHLHVTEFPSKEERHAPVDLFFRSVAEVCGPLAVAVVLSGTGPNGSTGIKRIREHGGLVVAQDPAEAEYIDMPRNAIATGVVDYVLPAGEIAERIASLRPERHEPETLTASARREREADDTRAAKDILAQLSVRTGHDFSDYKSGTVLRRIGRRVGVQNLPGIAAYGEFLRENPDELQALLNDLLISVTSFFRDPEAFQALDRIVVPQIFDARGPQNQIRAWVAGCATGEEAYSIAMLLAEYAAVLPQPPVIQVFATDLDGGAIERARDGVYTTADVADLSSERIRRFFTRTGEVYTVRRELRETVLFATHNVLKDPPFSHLDLVTCRNLLIYLNRAGQKRLIETFHFSLGGRGFLFLGSAESVDGANDLFVAVDKGAGLYQCRPVVTRMPLAIPSPVDAAAAVRAQTRLPAASAERIGYADLQLRLLEEYAPPSIILNEDYSVMHLSERAGRYLHISGGEPSRNILTMIRPELRMPLRTALAQAAHERVSVAAAGLEMPVDDHVERVTITVRPVLRQSDPARGFFLVLFQGDEISKPAQPQAIAVQHPARQLEDEVIRLKSQLQGTVAQYETQAEELRASNEELQAVNEELRSAVEELETSKEELQSINEELITVNQELKNKIDELSQTNNDFQNLINSTDIATIFLDRFLRVKLFTPKAREIFNLIAVDIGRPLLDIASSLNVPDLHTDVERVLETLQAQEREVQTRQGRWFSMRILPYRTVEDRIDGVIMIFFDITQRRAAELLLAQSQERVRVIIETATDYAIFTVTPENIIDSWNIGAERIFGYSGPEIVGQSGAVLYTPEDRAAQVPAEEMRRATADGRATDERWHVRKDGSRIYCSGVMTPLREIGRFAKIARDLTEQQQAQNDLQSAHRELETRVADRTAALAAEVGVRREAEMRANALVRQLVTVQEDERRRIARDLHDQLGQQFTALRMQIEAHRQSCTSGGDQLKAITAQAERIDTAIEFLAWQLRPAVLDDLGLVAALRTFVTEWSAHTGTPATFDATSLDGDTRLPPESETHLYRIAQEALNNVAKHARASSVEVLLGPRDRMVSLIIEDDGVGFDADAEPSGIGLGLNGMRERARLCGGTLQIESRPGHGTTVFVALPVSGQADPP